MSGGRFAAARGSLRQLIGGIKHRDSDGDEIEKLQKSVDNFLDQFMVRTIKDHLRAARNF